MPKTLANPPRTALLDALTRNYSMEHQTALDTARELDAELAAVRKRFAARLQRQLSKVADAQAALTRFLEANAAMFTKPRTMTLNGVKVGYALGKPAVLIPDEAKTIQLIEERMPDVAEALINRTPTLVKTEIAKLPAKDLRKIGCGVRPPVDAMVLKIVDSEAEKFVARVTAEMMAGERSAKS